MLSRPSETDRLANLFQAGRFILNGLFATGVHYSALTGLLLAWDGRQAGIANFLAALVGITVSFLGNRYFVFGGGSRTLLQQLVRFLPLYGALAVVHGLILFVWTDWLGLDYQIGFLIGIVVQVVCSYLANKFWVFSLSRLLKAIGLSLAYVVVLLAVYAIHVYFFSVSVVFYSAILDGIIAAFLLGIVLFFIPSRFGLDWFAKVLLIVIWLLGGYAFAISIPTVIDRSLSMYILEKLDQRGGGIRRDQFERVFVEEYMPEYRLVDIRLTEQLASGTIVIEDGCVKLTEYGQWVARLTRYLRSHFLAKKRLLNDGYTDALTDPLGTTPTGKVGYECE